MGRTPLDDYTAAMGAVTMTDGARETLKRNLIACRRKRARNGPASGGQKRAPAAVTAPRAVPRSRRSVLKIAAAGAVVLIGTATAATVISLWDTTSQGPSPVVPAAPSFVLAAYADGVPVDEGADTVLAGPGFLDSVTGWSMMEPVREGYDEFQITLSIDLSVYGDTIDALTYEIDGDESASFSLLSRNTLPDGTLEEPHGRRLHVTADQLESTGTKQAVTLGLDIRYSIPTGQEPWRSLEERYREGTSDEFRHETTAFGARLLTGRTITVTATFQDGTQAEQAYRIAAVDDIVGALRRNDEAFLAYVDAYEEDPSAEPPVPEPLFTLTRVL